MFPFKHSNKKQNQNLQTCMVILTSSQYMEAPLRALHPIIQDCSLRIHLILAEPFYIAVYSFFSSACLPLCLHFLLTRREANNDSW